MARGWPGSHKCHLCCKWARQIVAGGRRLAEGPQDRRRRTAGSKASPALPVVTILEAGTAAGTLPPSTPPPEHEDGTLLGRQVQGAVSRRRSATCRWPWGGQAQGVARGAGCMAGRPRITPSGRECWPLEQRPAPNSWRVLPPTRSRSACPCGLQAGSERARARVCCTVSVRSARETGEHHLFRSHRAQWSPTLGPFFRGLGHLQT